MPGYPCCCTTPRCKCSLCAEGVPTGTPCCMEVTIAGLVDFDPRVRAVCGCTCLDDTYHLRGNACDWLLEMYPSETDCTSVASTPAWGDTHWCRCGMRRLLLTLYKDGADYILKLTARNQPFPGLPGIVWKKNFGTTAPTCNTMSGEVLAFDAAETSSPTCDATGSTCTVSAFSLEPGSCPPDHRVIGTCFGCKCQVNIPDQFAVTFTGIVDHVVGGCSTLNNTFILTRIGLDSQYPFACRYAIAIPEPGVEYCFWDTPGGVILLVHPDGRLMVQLGQQMNWLGQLADAPPVCTEISGESLTPVVQIQYCCNNTSSTCTVTAA